MTRVFVSSATGSLAPHRQAAVDVCVRHEMTPVHMERFSADPRPPLGYIREQIDTCGILVLIIGDRYGSLPPGEDLGYTELEYDYAVSLGNVVILAFVVADVLRGAAAAESPAATAKLARFVAKVSSRHLVRPFASVDDFRLDVYQSLEPYKQAPGRPAYHRRRVLPSPPQLCAMPEYVGGSPFTGRAAELAQLDEWAEGPHPVLVVEAIGGTGKSALTWEWATRYGPAVIDGYAGCFWWSFYDGSASIDRFLLELLAYVEPDFAENPRSISREDLPDLVLTALRRRPFLVVLDGFERLLLAYHRYDPSKVSDEDVAADRRANKHAMIDPLGYRFVRRLAGLTTSKILVSTRMAPDALEASSRSPLPGVVRLQLPGLGDEDVVKLAGSMGVTGRPREINKFFRPFGNHPLLITIVAGLVRDHRPAPGDFAAWLASHQFRLADLDLTARRRHILAAALDGLDAEERRLLGWMSVMSATLEWRVLQAINPYLPGEQAGARLDAALRTLEERGLLWWNRSANTYDMHPIVRGYAHEKLDSGERIGANVRLRDYFQAQPPADTATVTSVEDLQQTIQLFRALTGAQQYVQGERVWQDQLAGPLLEQLGANGPVRELLEPYQFSALDRMQADLSIAMLLSGRYDEGITVEKAVQRRLGTVGGPAEVKSSLGRMAAHYLAAGRFRSYAEILTILAAAQLSPAESAALSLRRLILEVVCRDGYDAGAGLRDLEARQTIVANNPWFGGDLRYWRLVHGFRNDALTMAEIEAAEQTFTRWRTRLRLARLKFDLLIREGDHARGLAVAEDVDRLRRVGGQEVVSAESALAYAYLGRRAEARTTLDECVAAMDRQHPFDRPYLLVAQAFAIAGERKAALSWAGRARLQAWADGQPYTDRWSLRQAEALITAYGGRLTALPDVPAPPPAVDHRPAIDRITVPSQRPGLLRRLFGAD
ncbi:DUF4062 domain-containing protein [Paractinoplanes rishiriensis]|uniref:DUF4062 domain-containing protein n=1 Tax=Paractinoplanes rishiriensis TaxID=1050105 RepID=A0A919JSU7_9ACTN|nr:DUF4062 domain-containing protein [Actinoplanes rishiriensis]GIE92568.1 hypothetical protein Ari01nite_00330 [Actinoplanes rishiriensis]